MFYTHELVDELEVLLGKLIDIDQPSKVKKLTSHDGENCVDGMEVIEKTVVQLKILAQLFTQQPESVLMAIRFDFHVLLPKIEKQLSRLIPESKFTETTTTIAGTDLSVQYKT